MMQRSGGDYARFEDIIETIFAAPTKQDALDVIELYDTYWMEIIGTRGAKGKKAKNSNTMFKSLFEVDEPEADDDETEFDSTALDNLEGS
jgi:hypothetical protein